MSRSASILSVVVVMTITVLATVAVAFAVPGEGSNGQAKVTICHKDHVTISVAEPAWPAHDRHGDTEGACTLEENEGALPEEPSEGTTPTLTTDATDTATLPDGTISDVATLDVPDGTTGTIEFKLYGPFDTSAEITATSCVDPDDTVDPPVEGNLVYSDTVTVPTDEDPAGSGEYPSGSYTPTEPGYYQWVATFTSDTEGVDPSSTPCGDTTEQSLVNDATSATATEQNVTLAGEIGENTDPADPATDTSSIEGTNQDDNTILGTDSDDHLYGDASANILLSRHGNDFVDGGQGPDRVVGGAQGDYLNAADGRSGNDVINGGIGTDYCVGDVGDEFKNCDGNVVKVPIPPQSAAPAEASN